MARTEVSRFKCDDCGQLCRSEVGLTRHVKARHTSKQGDGLPKKADEPVVISTRVREEYTPFSMELAEEICEQLAAGSSLRRVCFPEDMPHMRSIFRWLRTNEEFRKMYEKAKEEAADALIEEIMDIADDGSNDYMLVTKGDQEFEVLNSEHLQRSRLRVDTRKWIAAKMKPKKYGDKLDLTSDGKPLPTPIYGGKSGKSTPKPKQT